ncbi:hypothetical protein AO382_1976 [Moraxella catarrhalis]|uniref:Uncharacterized protein n=1 Tax=Moraxella catarrhalis TaxID=480 RepID=A0A7Z0UX76_MORCA|nr:hypothetical protein AO382_1976 [Moraxella catarrhalis]
MNHNATTQLTDTLWRFFGQNVTLECLLTLEAIGSFFETLGGTTFGFKFHNNLLN